MYSIHAYCLHSNSRQGFVQPTSCGEEIVNKPNTSGSMTVSSNSVQKFNTFEQIKPFAKIDQIRRPTQIDWR